MLNSGQSGDECVGLEELRRVVIHSDITAVDDLQRAILPFLSEECEFYCRRYRLPKSESVEICYELVWSLVKYAQSNPSFLDKTSCTTFYGYLSRMVRNRVIDRVRTLVREKDELRRIAEMSEYQELSYCESSAIEEVELTRLMLSTVDQQTQTIIERKFFGDSWAEIAEFSGRTVGAAKQQFRRGIEEISEMMERIGIEL